MRIRSSLGYPESFTALLELLDNQRFARGTPPDKKQLSAVMVRRLKSELPKDDFGNDRFPKRTLEAIEVDYPAEEKRIHAALRDYTKLRHAKAEEPAERFAAEFVLMMLKKRLFSCPAAFAITLAKHEASLSNAKKRKSAPKPSRGILQRQIDRVEEDYSIDDEAEEAAQEAVDTASLLFHEPTGDELALLKEMKTWAERAKSRLDAKARELIRWLHENIRPGGKWSNQRVKATVAEHGETLRPDFIVRNPDDRAPVPTPPQPVKVRHSGWETSKVIRVSAARLEEGDEFHVFNHHLQREAQ